MPVLPRCQFHQHAHSTHRIKQQKLDKPDSRFPIPYSLLPTPYSLLPTPLKKNSRRNTIHGQMNLMIFRFRTIPDMLPWEQPRWFGQGAKPPSNLIA
ncbi:hypothetical protein [Moorena producens]|nr:hypothetical protein [Moorena producens]